MRKSKMSATNAMVEVVALAKMEWISSDVQAEFYKKWHLLILKESTLVPASDQEHVYEFINGQLEHVLSYIKKPGQAGWSFRSGLSMGTVERAVIWANGSSESSQCRPLSLNEIDSQWWPCVVCSLPDDRGCLPFYCPALAWQRARPWYAHHSRVFLEQLENQRALTNGAAPVPAKDEAHRLIDDMNRAPPPPPPYPPTESTLRWELID